VKIHSSQKKKIFPELKAAHKLDHNFHFLFYCVASFSHNTTKKMQKVEQLDEDSSYDSDTEIVSSPHQNVSRNVSETLAQELLEDFNSVSISFFFIPSSSSNTGSPAKY
jgi:hypothetical protein